MAHAQQRSAGIAECNRWNSKALALQNSNSHPTGHATPAQAARRLGLGVRTLNRRLEDEGQCFSQLHDESRYSLARQLLRFTRMPVGQVASSLAYANASAFTRAFRRWSGESPARWRGSI
jgi:AraC-like DNA-binding protein